MGPPETAIRQPLLRRGANSTEVRRNLQFASLAHLPKTCDLIAHLHAHCYTTDSTRVLAQSLDDFSSGGDASMHISVIGTGYVGLVTGACFAEFGVNVTCMDTDARRIAKLEKGEVPFYEPGITELVAKGIKEDRLHFTTDVAKAVDKAL